MQGKEKVWTLRLPKGKIKLGEFCYGKGDNRSQSTRQTVFVILHVSVGLSREPV